jgi:6-methylsalicylate decarboxylase
MEGPRFIVPPPWDADLTLSYMDEACIDVPVTSISTLGTIRALAGSLTRRCNELPAKLMQAPPNRLAMVA